MIVMKFGGTSVKDAQRIRNVAEIIKLNLSKKPVVVVSAVSGITDTLIEAAKRAVNGENVQPHIEEIKKRHHDIITDLGLDKELISENLKEFSAILNEIASAKAITTKLMDHVQSFGERMSSKVLAAHLTSSGIKAKAFSAWHVGMITTSEFGKAEPLEGAEKEIANQIKKIKEIPIVTGFIGKTADGHITTLGRGGSDYTGAIIGAAINASEIQIWTDVDGVMTADPRLIPEAKTIKELSFAEASEIAYFGAKVLHPKTIIPAMKKDIPVKILNTYNPKGQGTAVVNKSKKTSEIIKAISCKRNTTLLNISSTRMLGAHGFLARVFDIFEDYSTIVDMIATTEVSISLTINNTEKLDSIVKELSEIANVKVERNKAIVCAVGEGMKNSIGTASRIFSVLAKNNINIEMITQGASEINICFIVDMKDADKAVKALHKEYFG